MKIRMTVNLAGNYSYRYLLAVLYSDLKSLIEKRDHAQSHGDHYAPDAIPALHALIDGLEYGELIEGPKPSGDPELDAMAQLRRNTAAGRDR